MVATVGNRIIINNEAGLPDLEATEYAGRVMKANADYFAGKMPYKDFAGLIRSSDESKPWHKYYVVKTKTGFSIFLYKSGVL